jgi:hypothetical protein
MKDKRGFMPFSLAGFLLLMLVLAMVAYTAWSRHQLATNTIEDVTCESLLTTAAGVQSDLQHIARYAAYQALWEVCENADNYDNDDSSRENTIECLAAKHFMDYVVAMQQAYKQVDARVELEFQNLPSFELSPSSDLFLEQPNTHDNFPSFYLHLAENGYVLLEVRLQKQTRIRVSSWDNRITLALPCENFNVFIDCRYFLLQERMNKFFRQFDDIRSSWKWAEYAAAWGEALTGRVKLNESRSKTLFRLAWANQEFKTFGSADYPAVAMGLAGLDAGALAGLTSGANIAVKPFRVNDVQVMISYVDGGIQDLEGIRAELIDVNKCIEYARNEVQENSSLENVQLELGSAISSVGRILEKVQDVQQQFQQLLDYIAGKRGSDILMLKLYNGLTSLDKNYPPPARRISVGIEGVESKLLELEGQIETFAQLIQSSNGLENLGNSISQLYNHVVTSVQDLLAVPLPKYTESYEEYPDPSTYALENDPSPTPRNARIYIMEPNDGTIGTLDATLKDVKTSLERMEDVATDVELEQGGLVGAEIDGELTQALLGGLDMQPEQHAEFDREQLYELLPPKPIRPQPGISVFDELDIEDVKYKRVDPCGRLGGASAPPTPIPLWFIDVTLYWAQWEVTLELENNPIERIFDFPNQTLPRPPLDGNEFGLAKIHKALGYRYELPRKSFSFTLLIVSPQYFNIDAND